jgi:hypothetical protein
VAIKPKHEDVIFKEAMHYFAKGGLKFFGITQGIKSIGFTELEEVKIKNQHMDFVFLMEDDTYLHFEFQTTNKGFEELSRFLEYDSILHHKTNKKVNTIIIYTGGIDRAPDILEFGPNCIYRVTNIFMSSKDGENILRELKLKKEKGTKFDNEDLMKLSLIPLMGDKDNIKFRIEEAFKLTQGINDRAKNSINAMLYAFSSKFLKGKELKNVKEMFMMTELGRMILEDGIKRGNIEGEKNKAIQIAMSLLDVLPIETIAIKTGLSIDTIKELEKQQ